MFVWEGSAAVCVNDHRQLLMVLQGTPEEPKRWSVPSGGKKPGETLQECCVREVWEETGFVVRIRREMWVKRMKSNDAQITVHYFETEIIGGHPRLHDPDGLIHEVAWISPEALEHLELSFPEDRDPLLSVLRSRRSP
nr:NUDIX hydrolase [Brevibacillus thermoruber]